MCSQKTQGSGATCRRILTHVWVRPGRLGGRLFAILGALENPVPRLIKPQHRAALPVIDAPRGGGRANFGVATRGDGVKVG